MVDRSIYTGSFSGRVARITLFTIFVLIALSFQASACHDMTIGDRVWNDLNANGIQDSGEPGIEGVKVELYVWDRCSNNWKKESETRTDANGYYSFDAKPYYYYYLKFELRDGFVFSPRDAGRNGIDSDANVNTGATRCFQLCRTTDKWDAGMYKPVRPASVGNFVWKDVDNDGIQDSGEPGIEGVTVELYTCTGEYVDSVVTDSTGFYKFTGLTPGRYYLKFIPLDGYVFASTGQGDDASDSDAGNGGVTGCFALSSGEYNEIIDAGLVTPHEEIPEFPTIALPMAAILGLAFVFQRRKE